MWECGATSKQTGSRRAPVAGVITMDKGGIMKNNNEEIITQK